MNVGGRRMSGTYDRGVWLLALVLAVVDFATARANPGDDGERAAQAAEADPVPSAPLAQPLVEPEPRAPGRTPAIEHPEALAHFFAALARTEAGEGITRVTHMGDSSIGMDGLPHGLRRRFQEALGDAGPGFVLLQPHSQSYRNRTVELRNPAPWNLCFIIRRCRRDGRYGLGGVTVQSRGGARTRIAPREGRTVSRAELWYLAQPNGGRIDMRFGDRQARIDTSAPELEDRFHVMEREPGEHVLEVRASGGGPVRAYGVVLENEGPGVVWDTLSMIGAFTHRLLEHDEAHFAGQLARRDPDLVVLSYGGNDLRRIVHGAVDGPALEEETHRLLARVRAAVPDAACLVIGINDHTRSGNAHVHPRHVREVLGAQRDAAQRAGCAFWNTTEAMGGTATFEGWRRRGLASSDGKHLSARGRRIIAARLYAALVHARDSRAAPQTVALAR